MAIALTFIALGVLAQVVVLAQPSKASPRFTKICTRCGYHIPPMEYTPDLHDCPGCYWMDLSNRENIASLRKR